MLKSKLRNKIIKDRQIKNINNIKIPFKKIFKFIDKSKSQNKIVGGYFPINYEVDDLDILKEFEKKNYTICMPVIKKNFQMDFYKWNFKDPLIINRYGIPEPCPSNLLYPDIILVPLVAFDKNLYRLGYGGGYYDRFIEKIDKKKSSQKIGLALSCQKIKKVPITQYDKKLDSIVTEKYYLK